MEDSIGYSVLQAVGVADQSETIIERRGSIALLLCLESNNGAPATLGGANFTNLTASHNDTPCSINYLLDPPLGSQAFVRNGVGRYTLVHCWNVELSDPFLDSDYEDTRPIDSVSKTLDTFNGGFLAAAISKQDSGAWGTWTNATVQHIVNPGSTAIMVPNGETETITFTLSGQDENFGGGFASLRLQTVGGMLIMF